MVDDIEAPGPGRPINAANVDQQFEAATAVFLQHPEHRHNVLRLDSERQLAVLDMQLRDRSPQLAGNVLAELVKPLIVRPCHGIWVARAHQRSIVPVRRIFFCSSKTPYTSCSAVGGKPGTEMSTGTM